jgi:hypothetical protein
MATQDQAATAISRILVALNACDNLGLNWQSIIDWRQAAITEGRQITEEEMHQFAASLAE